MKGSGHWEQEQQEERRNLPVVIIVCAIFILVAFLAHRTQKETEDAEKCVRVGLVLNGDESTPYSSNFIQAMTRVEQDYSGRVKTDIRRNVAVGDVEGAVNSLVSDGCGFIVTTSYGFEDAAREEARLHPSISFAQATGDNANVEPVLDNYHTFMGRISEGRFIAGQVAGRKMSELISQNKISRNEALVGYVGAFPYPEVISGFTAFYLGVRDQCPTATMKVIYTGTWKSYEKEYSAAKKLIGEGCVVISQHSDTEGPAAACEEAQGEHLVYHAGYNRNMADVAPTSSLISTRIDWYPYLKAAVGAVLDGKNIESIESEGSTGAKTIGNDTQGGFDLGWVQMLPLNEPIAADGTAEMIEETEQEFVAGKRNIFQGDYHGADPDNPGDTIDLRGGYTENATASAPSFHYILDGIEVEK